MGFETSGISSGSHDITIRGFSLTNGTGAGKYTASYAFTVGGYDWVIGFYPEGINMDCSAYVSVVLGLASDGSDVRTLFELTLLDLSGKGQHAVFGHFSNSLPITLKCRGSMMGYERLLTRASLEASDYLKDDCLSMHCTIGVVREGSKRFTFSIPPCDMSQNLKYLLETETGCDIVIRVRGQTFKAHKSILAARSPVFRGVFFRNHPNIVVGDQIRLKDVKPSIFKAMLLFIYSDTLPDPMSVNMIQDLFAAANRFCVDRLKMLCEAKLCEQVNVDTVEEALTFADKHRCFQLKSVCLKFAHDNSKVRVD